MNDLESLYTSYLKFTDQMAGDHSAMAVAGVMLAQALSIYRTTLSPEDYNSMVDSISELRDQVKTFDFSRTLQ